MLRGLVGFIVILCCCNASWATDAELTAVNSYTMGDVLYTELNFSAPINPNDISIEYINSTIQLDIPRTTLTKEKLYRRVDHERVKSIYTYMPDKDRVRTRIIQKDEFPAEQLLGHVELEGSGRRILIKIFNPSRNMPAKVAIENTEDSLVSVRPRDIEAPPVFNERKEMGLDPKQELANLGFVKEYEEGQARKLNDSLAQAIRKPQEMAKSKTQSSDFSKVPVVKNEIASRNSVKLEAEDMSKKSESEIPLFENANKEVTATAASEAGTWGRLLISLAFIAAFAIGMTLFTKWWSKNRTKSLDTNKLRVLHRHFLGPKKELCVVQIAGESILIGVTDHNISMIKTLALLDDELDNGLQAKTFNSELERSDKQPSQIRVTYDPTHEMPDLTEDAMDVRDQFKVSDVKDIIAKRLENMRTF